MWCVHVRVHEHAYRLESVHVCEQCFFCCECARIRLGEMTWSDEDYIGKVSRATRRFVHQQNMVHSTMTKILIQYRKEWNAACSYQPERDWGSQQLSRSPRWCGRESSACKSVCRVGIGVEKPKRAEILCSSISKLIRYGNFLNEQKSIRAEINVSMEDLGIYLFINPSNHLAVWRCTPSQAMKHPSQQRQYGHLSAATATMAIPCEFANPQRYKTLREYQTHP